eukprot:102929_1
MSDIDMSRVEIKLSLSKLKDYCKENKKKIIAECIGYDKNKNECKRGASSGVFRLCSNVLRQFIPDTIISDNKRSEFCVMSTHCKRCCFPNPKSMISTPQINIARAISEALMDSNKPLHRDDRWRSFMSSKIGSEYASDENNTHFRIKIDNKIWIDYYIRLTAMSTIIKTCSPSGYKYNDRISFGKMIMMQGCTNKNVSCYITKDSTKPIDAQ